MARLRSLLFSPPDEVLVEIAAGGEKFAAYTRLFFIIFIWLVALLFTLLIGESRPEFMAVTIGATLMLCMACYYVYSVKSDQRRTVSHFLVSLADISLISITLFSMAYMNKPELAINSMVVWEGYLIFILASCLYFDVRVCIACTLTAMLQYALILWWCLSRFDFPVTNPEAIAFTGYVPYIQFSRFVLMLIAAIIAIGIILRSRSLLSLSGTDTLTGLSNRRVFEVYFEQEISRSKRHNRIFSLAYFDLDHFKAFNSKWGHDVGDQVLKAMANAIRKRKRTEDILARWGGEEFVAIFPNTSKAEAVTLVERLSNYLKSGQLNVSNKNLRITFSAGIAEFNCDGEEAVTLLQVADNRMRLAKAGGRDKIVIHD